MGEKHATKKITKESKIRQKHKKKDITTTKNATEKKEKQKSAKRQTL
mgnify:CR=1 FL=1